MFGSTVLEVAIGLALIYLLLSVFCSAVKEALAGLVGLRASTLKEGIRTILGDGKIDEKSVVDELYGHPLIKGLARSGDAPSYVPSRNFALALLDILVPAGGSPAAHPIEDLRKKVANLSDESLRKALLPLIDDASGELKKAKENVEAWFNNAMDRVSGWYKRKAQFIIVCLALVVTALGNVDTLHITNALWKDNNLRGTLVAAAVEVAKQPQPPPGQSNLALNKLEDRLAPVPLPIGWSAPTWEDWWQRVWSATWRDWLKKIAGLLATTIAISLGAPFWFDVLGKAVSLRATGKPPEKRAQPTAGGAK